MKAKLAVGQNRNWFLCRTDKQTTTRKTCISHW